MEHLPPCSASKEDQCVTSVLGFYSSRLEAAGGFEPPNRGFADLRLSHLATPPNEED